MCGLLFLDIERPHGSLVSEILSLGFISEEVEKEFYAVPKRVDKIDSYLTHHIHNIYLKKKELYLIKKNKVKKMYGGKEVEEEIRKDVKKTTTDERHIIEEIIEALNQSKHSQKFICVHGKDHLTIMGAIYRACDEELQERFFTKCSGFLDTTIFWKNIISPESSKLEKLKCDPSYTSKEIKDLPMHGALSDAKALMLLTTEPDIYPKFLKWIKDLSEKELEVGLIKPETAWADLEKDFIYSQKAKRMEQYDKWLYP